MEKNVGNFDRVLRLVLAAVFIILFLSKTVTGTFGILLLIFSFILIFTAFTGFCGLYKILGIRTCKVK